MKFRVQAADGRAVEVEAVDWMMAMAGAIEQLGIEAHGWTCVTRPDGTVQVFDTASGAMFLVRRADAPPARLPTPTASIPPTRMASIPPVSTPPPPSPQPLPASPSAPTVIRDAAATPRPEPLPTSQMPTLIDESPPPDLAERLFDLSMDLASAVEPNDACRIALDVILKLVPCEAASVLRGSLHEGGLTFVAVSGPAADDLLGKRLDFGQGIVGACFAVGVTIQVDDVRSDDRHEDSLDQETGFRTRAVLCVPVRTQSGLYGVIELLNPPIRFRPWHTEVVESVARTLALNFSGGR